jgi:hypothetical protein
LRVLIEQTCHKLVYLLLSQSYTNGEFLLDHISRSSITEVRIERLTNSRFAALIGKSQAVISQSLLTAKGANLSKSEFLGAVTRPKTGSMKFTYPLDQSIQALCHLRFPSLLIDNREGTTACLPIEAQHAYRPRTTSTENPTMSS